MGAGGEATRRLVPRRADARAEAPQEAGRKSDLRRGTRGAFARGRRQTSYEKLHELADWKRIGLHDKYADATMVRDPRTRARRAREATTRHRPIGASSRLGTAETVGPASVFITDRFSLSRVSRRKRN